MSPSREIAEPAIESVLHPSDFSVASEVAFAHALKAALIARSAFTVMHVSRDSTADWTEFPGVRETLERWGLLPEGSARSEVARLGIEVRKVVAQHDDPVKSVLHYLESHGVDLIVLASHRRDGRATWLRKSVSEPVARKSGQMTLFVPEGVDGFVSLADGSVKLRSVLIPVAATPSAQPAIEAAARLVRRLECSAGAFTLLHVGGSGKMPAATCPEVPGWEWKKATRDGDVIDGIVNAAAEASADLIVMTTDGRSGFLDALRGSHSERVLRRASCPLLAIPEGSSATAAMAR
jgi:nucleotide-binding universal stress UspA family protein